MGAWIEIAFDKVNQKWNRVAPLVGAWIEISRTGSYWDSEDVAPLVGAWIEIHLMVKPRLIRSSLPLWERGLKSYGRYV